MCTRRSQKSFMFEKHFVRQMACPERHHRASDSYKANIDISPRLTSNESFRKSCAVRVIDGLSTWSRAAHCSSEWYSVIGRTELLSPILEKTKCCRPCHSYNTQLFGFALTGPVLLLPLSWLRSFPSLVTIVNEPSTLKQLPARGGANQHL